MPVECTRTIKTFALEIKDVFGEWYWDEDGWIPLPQAVKDTEWYQDEYGMPVVEASDLLMCWFSRLPGNHECWDYGDFYASFEMDEAMEANISESALIEILEHMADAINSQRRIESDEPWLDTGTDAYGTKYQYWRCPALDPVEGMPTMDYPPELGRTKHQTLMGR